MRSARPGMTLIALVVIALITTAWWALALWPAGVVEPEWLSRTRAACFGSAPGGLPDAGGWVLLIGEPLGMVGVLVAIWGRSLRRDIERLRGHAAWRILGGTFALLTIVAIATIGARAMLAHNATRPRASWPAGNLSRFDVALPGMALTDQRGTRVTLTDLRGEPVLLTFAFGHCAEVCPTIVRDLSAARRDARRPDVRLVVVTLDPWRDTPDRLPGIATHWALQAGDRLLSGSVADVQATLDTLGIGRTRNQTTGDIDHGGTVMFLKDGAIAWRLDGGWGRVRELLSRS